MKRFIILSLCIAGCLYTCKSVGQNDTTICDKYNIRSAELLFNFTMNNEDTLSLNAALWCLDSALSYAEDGTLICDDNKYKPLWQGRKLAILSLKRAYSDGIEYLKKIEFNIKSVPYYGNIVLKRFYAMQCQYEGDTICRNKYIRSILDNIESFIAENKEEIDLMCKNKDENIIYQNSLFFPVIQYYYYKSLIQGTLIVEKELDLLEKTKDYNPGFISGIKSTFTEDFLSFQGY